MPGMQVAEVAQDAHGEDSADDDPILSPIRIHPTRLPSTVSSVPFEFMKATKSLTVDGPFNRHSSLTHRRLSALKVHTDEEKKKWQEDWREYERKQKEEESKFVLDTTQEGETHIDVLLSYSAKPHASTTPPASSLPAATATKTKRPPNKQRTASQKFGMQAALCTDRNLSAGASRRLSGASAAKAETTSTAVRLASERRLQCKNDAIWPDQKARTTSRKRSVRT